MILYQKKFLTHLRVNESDNKGKIIAIDIETGKFAIADSILPATKQLFKQFPNAQPWVIRIGYQSVYHKLIQLKGVLLKSKNYNIMRKI